MLTRRAAFVLAALSGAALALELQPGEWEFTSVSTSGLFPKPQTQTFRRCIRREEAAHPETWMGKPDAQGDCRLKPGKVESPVHVADWMPTLTKLAGYQASGDLRWDGRDIRGLLEGGKAEPRVLYGAAAGFRGAFVRDGDWKLVEFEGGKRPAELYNLAADPNEQENLAAGEPERVARLKDLLAKAAAADNDRVPPKETNEGAAKPGNAKKSAAKSE